MPKYAIRSTVVVAFQWTGCAPDIPEWALEETRKGSYLFVDGEGRLCRHYTENWIDKLVTGDEGNEKFETFITAVNVGDYIVRTHDNAIFPCDKKFFEEKYFPLGECCSPDDAG